MNVFCSALVHPMWWPATSISYIPVWSSSDQRRGSVEWGWTVYPVVFAM